MILVSACLIGVNCRYDGENNKKKNVLQFLKDGDKCFIPVCPEQLGGLTTPRDPTQVPDGGRKVLDGQGRAVMKGEKDVTSQFIRGAEETLKIAEMFDVKKAILKDGSPSCGTEEIPSSLEGKKKGLGVTAALLERNGIEVLSEKEL